MNWFAYPYHPPLNGTSVIATGLTPESTRWYSRALFLTDPITSEPAFRDDDLDVLYTPDFWLPSNP